MTCTKGNDRGMIVDVQFDQFGLLQPVDHPGQSDRFHFQQIGKRGLFRSRLTVKLCKQAPLGPGNADCAGAFIERLAQHPPRVADQISKRVIHRGRYNNYAYYKQG